jgi:surface antigen
MRTGCISQLAPWRAVSVAVVAMYILATQMLATPTTVEAGEAIGGAPPCVCASSTDQSAPVAASPVPNAERYRHGPRADIDASDEIAALEVVQIALSEVGDGSSYIWHRRNGRLSGIVQPTASFRDHNGQICRHVIVSLSSGSYSRQAEGIACRLANGIWQLEG